MPWFSGPGATGITLECTREGTGIYSGRLGGDDGAFRTPERLQDGLQLGLDRRTASPASLVTLSDGWKAEVPVGPIDHFPGSVLRISVGRAPR